MSESLQADIDAAAAQIADQCRQRGIVVAECPYCHQVQIVRVADGGRSCSMKFIGQYRAWGRVTTD